MAIIHIDGKAFEVPDGQNLLAACLALGFDLPYFCWHPAMGSVGACRLCAVKQFKDEADTTGEIVMACLTPAHDGTRVSLVDDEVRAFRAGVIEWLMASHPHDCPVCDEGGECHLQDMTLMAGHVYRRYRYDKRSFVNQDLGPFLTHEMNRCIQCYRCVRFYVDYAGGTDLEAMGLRNHVYFGRSRDGRLQSEFSGNLVEVCPTGVFTDKTLADHYTRKWDLQTAPSVCVLCGLGCNTIPGERYGTLRRIHARYNGSVNGYFICDRGRFGYGFVNAGTRQLTITQTSREVPIGVGATAETAVSAAAEVPASVAVVGLADMIRAARQAGRIVAGIGSPRASLEANFALRTLVGADGFFLGVSTTEEELLATIIRVLREGPARSCSLRDLEQADAMLILGEDVTNTAPMLDYSLRQWLRRRPNEERLRLKIPEWNDSAVGEIIHEEPSALHVATVLATKLDRIALQTYRAAPDEIARLGFAVANLLDVGAVPVKGLSDDVARHAEAIAAALRTAQRPIVVSGTGCGSRQVIEAAASVAWSVQEHGGAAELAYVVPECNSLGLALLGGRSLMQAMQAVDEPGIDVLVVLENDLYRRDDAARVDRLLSLARHVVVLDHIRSRTTEAAEWVVPVTTFAESTGILVNNEGRAQRFYQVFPARGGARDSWRWLRDVAVALGSSEMSGWHDGGDVTAALAAAVPAFTPVTKVAPAPEFRIAGRKIARQPLRYSGRTAMTADKTLFEPAHARDPDSPLRFSMEGFQGQPPEALVPRYWKPGWNSVQAFNKYEHEVLGASGEYDPGVRLIEPDPAAAVRHSREVPATFGPYRDVVTVVPVHHIFGSEELSARSPAIAGLAPRPYLGLSPRYAERLGLRPGDSVLVETEERSVSLRVALVDSLPDGVPVMPVGLPGLEGWVPPFEARLRREAATEEEPRS